MKLARLGEHGAEKPVVMLDEHRYVDVSDLVEDYDGAFFASGGIARLRASVADRIVRDRILERGDLRIGAPFARPHQILCVGLNYEDHAAESGMDLPAEPILFTKAPNTLVGPNDDIRMPRGASKLDWEVELGVVIGRQTSYLASPADAAEAIAGYVAVNDVSERSFQLERGGQWVKGKSAETFNPAGPWLVTPEEVSDVNDLRLRLAVNAVTRQNGTTASMIFDVYTLVHYISQFMVLEPGDLINTGTPAGVGLGFIPPVWLGAGDVIDVSIDGLGTQRQRVIASR